MNNGIKIKINDKGRVLCPLCQRQANVKAYPATILYQLPLYCPWCKQETIINLNYNKKGVKK